MAAQMAGGEIVTLESGPAASSFRKLGPRTQRPSRNHGQGQW